MLMEVKLIKSSHFHEVRKRFNVFSNVLNVYIQSFVKTWEAIIDKGQETRKNTEVAGAD